MEIFNCGGHFKGCADTICSNTTAGNSLKVITLLAVGILLVMFVSSLVGIAIGAGCIALGGYCIYRMCCQKESPAVDALQNAQQPPVVQGSTVHTVTKAASLIISRSM